MVVKEPSTPFIESEGERFHGVKAAAGVKDGTGLRGAAFYQTGAGIEPVGRMDVRGRPSWSGIIVDESDYLSGRDGRLIRLKTVVSDENESLWQNP